MHRKVHHRFDLEISSGTEQQRAKVPVSNQVDAPVVDLWVTPQCGGLVGGVECPRKNLALRILRDETLDQRDASRRCRPGDHDRT
ncbi:MAG: hypothetical protein ACI9OJ_004164 [Myxococcota bacterium]|jgi:hypothetical protein